MAIKKYLWILISLVLVAGCESLEDTYSDYAGDGAIRYLGKCTKVSVAPGWKRLIVKWVNNVDPVIDKIKVRWQVNDMKDSILLAPNTTEYSIPDLEDGNYEVTVCAIDKNGNESLANPIFGRPYTPTLDFQTLLCKETFSAFLFNLAREHFFRPIELLYCRRECQNPGINIRINAKKVLLVTRRN